MQAFRRRMERWSDDNASAFIELKHREEIVSEALCRLRQLEIDENIVPTHLALLPWLVCGHRQFV